MDPLGSCCWVLRDELGRSKRGWESRSRLRVDQRRIVEREGGAVRESCCRKVESRSGSWEEEVEEAEEEEEEVEGKLGDL